MVRKLLKRMAKQGTQWWFMGLRGRPSNRKLPAETQRQALAILKQPDWHDFGPTFAAEQLAQRHQIEVDKETLLDGATVRLIAGTEGAAYPFWSPDSKSLAFYSRNKLQRVDLAGGTPSLICDSCDV